MDRAPHRGQAGRRRQCGAQLRQRRIRLRRDQPFQPFLFAFQDAPAELRLFERRDRVGFPMPLFECVHPGPTDVIARGQFFRRQTRLRIVDDALTQVHRICHGHRTSRRQRYHDRVLGTSEKRFRGAHAMETWEIDVENGDVGFPAQCDPDDGVAAIELRDDLDVRLELEPRDERTANEMHVLGDQHANHFATSGTSTTRRNVPSPPAPPLAVPDKADARAANPLNPCPPDDPGITPSFTISKHTPPSRRAMRIEHMVALLWRRMLVMPSRKAHAKSSSSAGDSVPAAMSTWVSVPTDERRSPARSISDDSAIGGLRCAMSRTSRAADRATDTRVTISSTARGMSFRSRRRIARSLLSETADSD